MIDYTKPLRFTTVQHDDHVTYRPRLVGSYLNNANEWRWVVAARYWDSSPSFIVYDENGDPIDREEARKACNSSGIVNATLINGDPITEHGGMINGVAVVVTFDGDKPVCARLETRE